MATWRELLANEFKEHGEEIQSLVTTLSDDELDREFDDGYGSSKGHGFTAWSTNRVYFPVVYDGKEWVGSVPRNPCNEISNHFGGE